MPREGISRGLGFWGMVGAVMVALKLKERYDDYSAVPGEEEGLRQGPVALRDPNLDEDATDGASFLDTQLPSGRPKRQRKADCCMCCGLRCGLFWKAFGIVCLLFLGWQAIRLALWATKAKPTGLENMPKFGTSLGCLDTPYTYKGGKQVISVPVGQNQNKGDHSLDFRGTAVGTVTLAQGEADLKDIKYELTLGSELQSVLDEAILDYPTQEEIDENMKSSRLQLILPTKPPSICTRFDVTIFLPPTVHTLHIQSHVTTQIRFDAAANLDLDSLFVTMYNLDENNMLLPTEGVHASKMKLQMTRGWLVGDLTLIDHAELVTQSGDATANVRVHPAASSADPPAPVSLLTTTGAGRTDVFFVSHPGFPHRPIDASHHSSQNGDLYLTYTDAHFSGPVDIAAKSFSATGLENAFKQDGGLPYHGSRDGGDVMRVRTQGWAGVYF